MPAQVVAEIVRSGFVEGHHYGSLVALDAAAPFPRGLLLLGQGGAVAEGSDQGSQLLQFLGAALGAMLRRWASN